MKILHLIFSFHTGGTELMLIDIMNRQAQSHKVCLCVINNKYSHDLLALLNPEIKILLINREEGSRNPADVLRMNYKIGMFNPDIIHSHNANAILYLPLHSLYKTVLTVHTESPVLNGLNKYNQVVGISSVVQNKLKKLANVQSEIIYNGVDASLIQAKEYGVRQNTFKIIQVGRLCHEEKGQHLLIKALGILKEKHNTLLYLDIIGEGPSLAFLNSLVNEYGIASQVNFLGIKNRDYIYAGLKDYDLLVQPSLSEGFGLTVAEGMIAGLPVLVSDSGGPKEIVDNGKYGFLFKKDNPEHLADQLLVLYNNSKLREEIAMRGKEYAKQNFTIETTVANYESLYESVSNK